MCVKSKVENLPASDCVLQRSKRRKIWELETSFHCGVIGTCLKLSELHQLCKKMRVAMPTVATDYDWHHSFVSVASFESFAAKTLNKHLDKKYKTTIKQVQKLSIDELDAFWDASISEDNLPAAYWAILTYPYVPVSLLDRIYGEVHMLSHLSGASLRVDMERLKWLEKENNAQNASANEENRRIRQKIIIQSTEIDTLNKKLDNTDTLKDELNRAHKKIEELSSNTILEKLKRMLAEAENILETKVRRIYYLEKSVKEWKKSAMDCGDQICMADMQLQELREENNAMEASLVKSLNQNCSSCDNQSECLTKGNLEGSCVLYVGGRDRQCAHFRALVEENNGSFLHHDGGLNDGSQHLGSLLPRADMIFCPIDCISHNAVNKVRRFCNQTGKPLIIMKRASLAAFTKGLSEVIA